MWSLERSSTPSSPDGRAGGSLWESSAYTFCLLWSVGCWSNPAPGSERPLYHRATLGTHISAQGFAGASAPRSGRSRTGAHMAEDSGRILFENDGRTQAAHRAVDWSATPLGPVAG